MGIQSEEYSSCDTFSFESVWKCVMLLVYTRQREDVMDTSDSHAGSTPLVSKAGLLVGESSLRSRPERQFPLKLQAGGT